MNTLSRAEQRWILKLMCRDNSIADIVEVTGHSPNTVRRHLARFGEALLASHDRLVRGIAPRRIEVDEIWSYVYAKRERNVCREEGKRPPPPDLGAFYTWTALDPDTRLFLGFHVGDRSYDTGLAFFLDLNSRLVRRPLVTTDGHTPYPDIITRTFGNDADHVVLLKEFKKWRNPKTGETGNVLTGLVKVPQNQTKVDLALASTSLVERMNGSIRNSISRFTRQTYKFSKRLERHHRCPTLSCTPPLSAKRKFTRAPVVIAVRGLAVTSTASVQTSGMPSRPSGPHDGAQRCLRQSSTRCARCV